MIKHIIFDIGGVILNPSAEYEGKKVMYMEDIASAFSLSYERTLEVWRKFSKDYQKGKIKDHELWQLFALEAGCPVPEKTDTLWTKRFYAVDMNPEVLDLIRRLRTSYSLSVLSNTIEPHVRSLEATGIFRYFNRLFLSPRIGMVKEKDNCKVFEYVAQELGLGEEKAVFIDDVLEFARQAEKAEVNGKKVIHGIHFTGDAGKLEAKLSELGVNIT